VSQQIYYSVLNREAEHELLPASVEEGLGNLIWSPLAGGLLTGKYRRDAPTPRVGRHLSDWREPPISDWEHVYDVVDAIVAVAESRGITPAQVALSYLLGTPGVTSLIVGARTETQLKDNLATSDVVLERDERERLDRASAMPLPYPMWHQVLNAYDRMRRSIVGLPVSTAGVRATGSADNLVALSRPVAQSVGLQNRGAGIRA